MARKVAVGDRFGEWTLREPLGAGGNGQVWLAEHSNGNKGALKLLHEKHLAASNARSKRFQHEATIQRRLSGTAGVLPLIDSSLPDNPSLTDRVWIVTELAQKMPDVLGDPQSIISIVEAIASIADVLAELHAKGISHRDLKPDNLFRRNGAWELGDFGLADFPEKEAITGPGEKLGPAYYIAPEMLNDAATVDGRPADVYSLAKVLWVVVSGHNLPLPGEQPVAYRSQTLEAITGHPRANFLDTLIERATKLDPARRPSMAEVAKELRAWSAPRSLPPEPLDILDIAQRIRSLSGPVEDEEARQKRRVESAQRTLGKIYQFMDTLRRRLINAGFSAEIEKHSQAWHFSSQRDNRLSPTRVWEGAYSITLSRSNLPADRLRLACVAGLALTLDGRVRVLGGYLLMRHQGHADRIAFSEEMVPAESAQLEISIQKLSESMGQNLGAALEKFAELIDKEPI